MKLRQGPADGEFLLPQAWINPWGWTGAGSQETPGLTQLLNSALGKRGVIQSVDTERKPTRGQNLLAINYSINLLFQLAPAQNIFPVSAFAKSVLPV